MTIIADWWALYIILFLQAFFTEEYIAKHPDDVDKVHKLKDLIASQVKLALLHQSRMYLYLNVAIFQGILPVTLHRRFLNKPTYNITFFDTLWTHLHNLFLGAVILICNSGQWLMGVSFSVQIPLLEAGIEVHESKITDNMMPLHHKMETCFDELRHHIEPNYGKKVRKWICGRTEERSKLERRVYMSFL